MTAGKKAGATRIYNINLNQKYGFKNPVLNRGMFENYINSHKPSPFTLTLLKNPLLSDEEMSKLTGKSVGTIRRFLPTAIQSVIKGKPCIGNYKLNIPELLKLRNKQRNNGKETRGRKPCKKLTTFNGKIKKYIHARLLSLMLDEKSPKSGKVATLPFNFVLEEKIIKYKKLNELMFNGYEYGKDPIQKIKSRIQFKRQTKILKNNKSLAERVVMYNHDINDALLKERESDTYSHILTDYCGTYSTNKETIRHILEKDLVKVGGLVWITLCGRAKRGDSPKKDLPNLIKKSGGNRYKVHTIEGEKLFPYFTSQAMFTTILRRIK